MRHYFIVLFFALVAPLPTGVLAAEPAPIAVYYGGPFSGAERVHPSANQSQGLIIDYLTKDAGKAAADYRRQTAEMVTLDYPLELMFSLRCVGLDRSSNECRKVHYVGPGPRSAHVSQFFSRNGDGLAAVAIDMQAAFSRGRVFFRSDISFIDRAKQPNLGPKVLLVTLSEKAPSGLRGLPVYAWQTSHAPSKKEQQKLKPVRDYWMEGDEPRLNAVMLQHLSEIAAVLDVFLSSDGPGDPAPQFDEWFEQLPTGKELFKANDQECPDSCKLRYLETTDGRYIGIKDDSGRVADYTVEVFE